jgi:glycosyltransferase involved in cell wall biosynthesis
MEADCLRSIDLLVPISLRDEAMLKAMGYEGPALTSPTGFDLSKISPCSNTYESSNIFHLGGLDWIPNQEGLLWFLNKCWGNLLQLKPDVHLHIAGRNAPRGFVESISQYSNVTYWGEVPDSREFICTKGIMIVPLLSGSGMRIKIVEGMALGKTIVSTRIGAEGINATDSLEIHIADTPELFVQKTYEALTDTKASNNMGKNARDYALLNFDNNIIVAKLFDFYRNQLSKRSSN